MTDRADTSAQQGRRAAPARTGGFTLVELITVIVILGILSLALFSRTGTQSGPELARMAEVRAQIRYVQLRAMKTGQVYGLKCDAASYWAFNGTDPDNAAARQSLPGETNATISLAGKPMAMTAFTYFFDGFGIPYTAYNPAGVTTKLAPPVTPISITASGSTGTLTLTPETGYVP